METPGPQWGHTTARRLASKHEASAPKDETHHRVLDYGRPNALAGVSAFGATWPLTDEKRETKFFYLRFRRTIYRLISRENHCWTMTGNHCVSHRLPYRPPTPDTRATRACQHDGYGEINTSLARGRNREPRPCRRGCRDSTKQLAGCLFRSAIYGRSVYPSPPHRYPRQCTQWILSAPSRGALRAAWPDDRQRQSPPRTLKLPKLSNCMTSLALLMAVGSDLQLVSRRALIHVSTIARKWRRKS